MPVTSLSLLCFALLLLIFTSPFLHINAKREMIIVEQIQAPSFSLPSFSSAVIDTKNAAAYFGTYGDPAQVCKFNVSTANFSLVSCIAAPSGTGYMQSAVIDTENSAAYFGAATDISTQLCKYNVSSTNFSFVSCITSYEAFFSFTSAVIDTENSAAYFGTGGIPGQVCKYNISSADLFLVSCIAAPSGVNGFSSAVIDAENSAAYFGASNGPAQVCIYNISSFHFSLVSCITAPFGVNEFHSAVIDTQNSAAYFGTYTGQVCKYNVSPANFSFLSCIRAPYGVKYFRTAVIDTQNSAAYFGTAASNQPGQVCKFNISSSNFSVVSCVAAPSGANSFYSAVISTHNSAAYFGTWTTPGRVVKLDLNAFGCNSDGQLEIGQDDVSRSNAVVNFVALEGCDVTMSSVDLDQPITFLQSIGNSTVTLHNITSTSSDSFVSLASSTPFTSPSTLTFTENQFAGAQLLISSSNVDLSDSTWLFKCNKWVNGYDYVFRQFANQRGANDVILDCPRTHSLSLSEPVFCPDLDEQQCTKIGIEYCRFCSNRNLCVRHEQDCSCSPLSEAVCSHATGCHFCNNASVCVDENVNCDCFVFDEASCKVASSTCRWCSNFNSCLTLPETCYCSTLSETVCSTMTRNECTYCAEQEICLPTTDFNNDTCSCLNMNSSNCQKSKCSWCDDYQTCGLPSWDCDCTSLSNNNSSCVVNSNSHCKLCEDESVCVDAQNFTCRCENFTESVCGSSSCKWCDTLNSCTIPENTNCSCYFIRGQQSCDSNTDSICHFCSNFDSCLPKEQQCYCSALQSDTCSLWTNNNCTYCPEQEICLPTAEVDLNTCSCLKLNSSNCQQSTCSWCSNYETCGLSNWDCDCTSLSNTSASSCSVNSNSYCKLCQDESVCVDVQNFTCRCENFTQSVCGSSSCSWCDTLNSCTVPENVNCTCNWLRGEDSCNHNSNKKCKWCSTSSDAGTHAKSGYKQIKNFDYCINNDGEDQCQCSYLSPSFCSFANDPALNKVDNFSTACRYCAISDVCTHPENKNCDCGNFATVHSCGVASLCSWKEPVLTFDGATPYCSAASLTCSPVTCEGILTRASCESAGCGWNPQTLRCDSKSACFNFFVGGFTPQPMILWIVGLLKDVLVVFLVGAFANTFTRPIMKFVSAVKKQVLKQTHIKQRTMEDTVYMSDKHCRNDVEISFPRYVEMVCESVFCLENDDLLDEDNRLVLFDAVAFTLFDNMIWLDAALLEVKQEEVNYSKRFGLSGLEPASQHEMKDLTVDQVDVNDECGENGTTANESQNKAAAASDMEAKVDGATYLEMVTAGIIEKMTNLVETGESDVNDRGQLLGRFAAAVTTQYDTYLKTKNVDLFKIKVLLTAQDFESAVTLRKKVDDCLLERASAYVFYDQSRDRKVCAATSANTFPPALNLVYYSVALVFLFITSFITVKNYPNIARMVKSCTVIPSNVTTNSSSSNSSTPGGDDGATTEFTLNSSNLTGAYFLLGFRLLNSSAFSTAILVFVKVIRGLYQRYSGIYSLSLQERIPLMALYSDRFIHVMLFFYALLVLPFALCGPTYGSSFGIYCWVPIFIAAAILIGDAIVLYASRRFTAIKNRLLTKKDENEDDEKQKALSKTFADLNEDFEDFLDSSSVSRTKLPQTSELNHSVTRIPSAKPEQEEKILKQHRSKDKEDGNINSLSENLLSPREGDGNEDEDKEDNNKLEGEENSSTEEETQRAEAAVKHQSSIESLSPVDLWNAILVFIMTEEIPVIVISLALQLSFNYAALLHYGDAFGLSTDKGNVYGRDYDSRSVECLVSVFKNDVSSFVAGLSSFVPFM